MTMLCSLLTVCSVSAQISRHEGTDGQAAIYRLPRMERAFLCCRYFEGWHSEKHYPYVGWGHKLLPNEKFRLYYTAEGDEAHNFIVVVEDLCNGQHTSSNVAMTFMFNSASNDE